MEHPKPALRKTTNYRRGADAERRAIKELLHPRADSPDLFRLGWHTAIRSAGSRGTWDINLLGPHAVLYVQVKRVDDPNRARRLLVREARRLTRLPRRRKTVPPGVLRAVLVWTSQRWLGAIKPSDGEPTIFF